jgi:thioredoxin-dependent peroxiredoxin
MVRRRRFHGSRHPGNVGAMLKVGDRVPDFTSVDHNGNPFTPSDGIAAKKWQVIYFYPKDDTPGCTAEACSFRDGYEDFTDAGAVVVGVSGDSAESHVKFAAKHRLPFALLSDGDGALRAAFGVKKSLGIIDGRVTFVIDPGGIVRKAFSSQIRASRHQAEALETIRGADASA